MAMDTRGATFLEELRGSLEGILDKRSNAVLTAINPRSARQLDAILRSFPSLGKSGALDLPAVGTQIARMGGAELRSFRSAAVEHTSDGRPRFAMGATAPPGSEWRTDVAVRVPENTDELEYGSVESDSDVIDLRHCTPWPVRNQAQRGTCVSFAATALREALDCEQHGSIRDLSEQFLYWVIKLHTNDPNPTEDGTFLELARDAVASHGICEETAWPYDPTRLPGNAAHDGLGHPTQDAVTEAAARRLAAGVYEAPSGNSGKAQRVLDELRKGRPVAVSLPVFVDAITGDDNWNTDVGILFGDVIDPVPTSYPDGGHAVCITGFVPDPLEHTGGYFVIRNSWGSHNWGSELPDLPDYAGPEPGYGQISATYIDRYLWEMLRL